MWRSLETRLHNNKFQTHEEEEEGEGEGEGGRHYKQSNDTICSTHSPPVTRMSSLVLLKARV